MRISSKSLAWIGGGALVILAGCSGSVSSRPPASQLQEGLNLLDVKDPTWGVSAAYMKQNRVIYIESRVGNLKPEVYRLDDPSAPQYEMDVRFVDQNGHTFMIQRGGDSYVEPSWAQEIKASRNIKIDLATRELDFKLAQEASASFMTLSMPALKDHVYHMATYAAQQPPSLNQHLIDKSIRIAKNPPPVTAPATSETGYGTYYFSGYSWPETDEYGKGTMYAGSHTSTMMWDCQWNGSSCSWVTGIVTCNHGTCANQSAVSYRCYTNSGWYNNLSENGTTNTNASGSWDGQGGCQTGYSWSSSNNAHLCNDDTAMELWQAKYGTIPDVIGFSSSGWGSACLGCCCGASPTTYSCNYPNGDWNAPNCL
jgi:hypothetical protein